MSERISSNGEDNKIRGPKVANYLLADIKERHRKMRKFSYRYLLFKPVGFAPYPACELHLMLMKIEVSLNIYNNNDIDLSFGVHFGISLV